MAEASNPAASLGLRFVKGSAGKVLWTTFEPSPVAESDTACIILPPFAEEMNKSRRMLALQGRRLAQAGVTTVLPDLFGTGDSEGDLSEATVSVWTEDVALICRYLVDRGKKNLLFLGVRMGCLLCGPVLARLPSGLDAGRIVFWQPYASGAVLIREFRRLKVAADMARGDSAAAAEAADSTEIAGYVLSDRLAQELSGLTLLGEAPTSAIEIGWIEMSLSQEPAIRTGSRRVISALREQGHRVSEFALSCPPFWSATEIVESEHVLSTTGSFFLGGSPDGHD